MLHNNGINYSVFGKIIGFTNKPFSLLCKNAHLPTLSSFSFLSFCRMADAFLWDVFALSDVRHLEREGAVLYSGMRMSVVVGVGWVWVWVCKWVECGGGCLEMYMCEYSHVYLCELNNFLSYSLSPDQQLAHGSIYFSLRSLPLHVTLFTQHVNRVTRSSENEVAIAHVHKKVGRRRVLQISSLEEKEREGCEMSVWESGIVSFGWAAVTLCETDAGLCVCVCVCVKES